MLDIVAEPYRHVRAVFGVAGHERGEALPAPFPTRINTKRGREPDILYVRQERVPDEENSFLDGAADIAIEIVSEGGAEHDYVTKFSEYQERGVREYWIINPGTRDAQFYRLSDVAFSNVFRWSARMRGFFKARFWPVWKLTQIGSGRNHVPKWVISFSDGSLRHHKPLKLPPNPYFNVSLG